MYIFLFYNFLEKLKKKYEHRVKNIKQYPQYQSDEINVNKSFRSENLHKYHVTIIIVKKKK